MRAVIALEPRLDPRGPVPIEVIAPGFAGLIHLILGQQVSIEAADAMFAGLEAKGPVTPDAILALDSDTMRRHGFTRMKEGYARSLAAAVIDGLDLDAIGRRDVDSAVRSLTALPGIGRWTAECYLLFSARRRDVFPAGDLALRVGWQEIAGLPDPPPEPALRAIAERWAPRRSAAAHLIWHRYLVMRGRR
jgi:DNA-3-methyladenine glycosylase II